MTVRSVVISFFIIAISFGMTVFNTVNNQWAIEKGSPLVGYNRTSFMGYDSLGIPYNHTGYNATMQDMMSYRKPSDVVYQLDFFQAIRYGSLLFDVLFNSVFGFPSFLANAFGMPLILVTPLTLFLVLNHILAIIYIVTGRTFIY